MYGIFAHTRAKYAKNTKGAKLNTPGDRLRYIREVMLNKLSAKTLEKRYSLSRHKIYNWETGRINIKPIVLEGYLQCLEKEGVSVSPAWVLEGVGDRPKRISPLDDIKQASYPIEVSGIPEHILMVKDVGNFNLNHPHPICVFVDSSCMLPYYAQGDYVCGNLVFQTTQMLPLVGKHCIIFSKDHGYLVRRVDSVNADNTFNVSGTNTTEESKITNLRVDSMAEILLHRKARTV